MKKIISIILVTVFLMGNICVAEATREELYHKFGPVLVEAIVRIIKDEINLIRAELSLPERTNQQMVNAIETKLSELTVYEWMNVAE